MEVPRTLLTQRGHLATRNESLTLLMIGTIFGQGRFANTLCYQGRELPRQCQRSGIHTGLQQRRKFCSTQLGFNLSAGNTQFASPCATR
jgi:hypothetical protein